MTRHLAYRIELVLLVACVVTCAFTLISVREVSSLVRASVSARSASLESEYIDPLGVAHRVRTAYPLAGFDEALETHAEQLEAIKAALGEEE